MRKPIHQPLGKGLRSYLGFALWLSLSPLFAQQCPSIINCPQSTPTYCDLSTNNIDLWNHAPFTYAPTIGSSDVPEAEIDLNLKVKGCYGGGFVTISFLLFLDLDNDGLQETVLSSNAPPPPGVVLANNIFNPGYSGGDTVRFDQRALPDSMRYRFTMEIAYSGDTTTGWIRFSTDAAPYDFSPVQLPEGRHRIEWRIAQDGVERFCDRSFKVKDCAKPVVACKSGISVYLDVTQSVVLNLSDALDFVSDNITPDTQLVLGMRRVGVGIGFPMDAQGNPQDTVRFHCDTHEDQAIEIWAQDRTGNFELCSAPVLVYDTAGFCPLLPFPSICARNYSTGEILQDVTFNMTWVEPNLPPVVNPIELNGFGCAELSSIPATGQFTLSASKDTVPLNGVTTFDLVLISKHILAIAPFDAGWKLAAADANSSNSVTTFDILELRKLILGLRDNMPNSTPSWRFYVDTCTVWGSPFFGSCPTEYSLPVQPISSYPPNLSFRALKMGDVNGSASNVDTLQGSAQARGSDITLELPDRLLQKGETMDLPLSVRDAGAWEGFQFALEYDPERLELEMVHSGGTLSLNSEHWAIPKPGVLNLSWSDARPFALMPGDALLYLRVKARASVQLAEVLQLSSHPRIRPEAYDAEGSLHPIQLAFSNKLPSEESGAFQVFSPMPNPTTGASALPLRLKEATAVTFELLDLSGKTLWQQVTNLEAGAHFLEIPASAMPQAGVYFWRVCAGPEGQSGRLVRIY